MNISKSKQVLKYLNFWWEFGLIFWIRIEIDVWNGSINSMQYDFEIKIIASFTDENWLGC
jgi:hypothetical protein